LRVSSQLSWQKKETVKIRIGEKPAMNTGKTAQPTPLDMAAVVAINGAMAHMSQGTRFGLVPPLNIERM
jgi:hypothetical protein